MAWIKLEHLQQFAEKFSAKASDIFARKEDIPKSLPADGGDASTVNGHTVNSDVPEGAKFTDTNTTYSVMKAASASEDGSAGLVPAPEAGKQNAFLKGDGTWEKMEDIGLDKKRVLTTTEQVQANTNAENVVGALVVKELIDNLANTKNNSSEYIVRGGALQAVVRDNTYIYSDIPSITGYSILAKMHKLVGDHNNTYIEFVLSENDNRIWVRNMNNTFVKGETYNIMYMALYHKK